MSKKIPGRTAGLIALLGGALFGAAALAQEEGAPPAECVAPGPLLLSDPAGDVNPLAVSPSDFTQDNLDLRELNLYQTLGEDGQDLLVFRLKAESLADGLIPSTAYYSSFAGSADDRVRGVRMEVDETSAVSFFSYLASESNAGTSDGRFVQAGTEVPAHPSSGFSEDGEILILVPPGQLGLLAPGEALVGFNAATTFTIGGSITGTMDEMPDGLSRMGSFAYQDSADCALAEQRGLPAAQAGGAVGWALLLILAAGLGRRRA